jgi:hypothetical protein
MWKWCCAKGLSIYKMYIIDAGISVFIKAKFSSIAIAMVENFNAEKEQNNKSRCIHI